MHLCHWRVPELLRQGRGSPDLSKWASSSRHLPLHFASGHTSMSSGRLKKGLPCTTGDGGYITQSHNSNRVADSRSETSCCWTTATCLPSAPVCWIRKVQQCWNMAVWKLANRGLWFFQLVKGEEGDVTLMWFFIIPYSHWNYKLSQCLCSYPFCLISHRCLNPQLIPRLDWSCRAKQRPNPGGQ